MQRHALFALIVGGIALVAGCTTGTDTGGAAGTPTHSRSDGQTTADDALKTQALALYTAKPFATTADKSSHHTPAHSWLMTSQDTLALLHWNDDDPAKATGLLFTGDGFRGKFCAGEGGVTREQYDAGFVHFHTATAANWDAGHNAGGADGAPTTDGWWLRHFGAGDMTMTMMGESMQIQKGKVFHLMPAGFEDLEACEGGDHHGFAAALDEQLRALYTSTPYTTTADKSQHNTPAHTWLQTGPDDLLFLHWDHDDPTKATGLLFTGDGFRGKFCAGDAGVTKAEYDAGFVHFHTAHAPNWDAGHNAGGADGAPTTDGWWLRHIGAGDMTMTMMGQAMEIQKGKVFPLMPAGFDNLEACAA